MPTSIPIVPPLQNQKSRQDSPAAFVTHGTETSAAASRLLRVAPGRFQILLTYRRSSWATLLLRSRRRRIVLFIISRPVSKVRADSIDADGWRCQPQLEATEHV